MAGYSGKPLVRKLGIKRGMRWHVAGAPRGYAASLGAPGKPAALTGTLDFVQLFTTSRAELARQLPRLIKALRPAGMIWISWPKKAAKVPTDITEDVIREVALPLGVVDVKVCAVDDTWSGLKLVRRLENR